MRTTPLVLLFACRLAAQPGSIDGTVVVQGSSKPLAGVHVRLYNEAMLEKAIAAYGAMTDIDGRYSVASIPPGTYDVQMEHTGFVVVLTNNATYTEEIVVHRGEHIAGHKLSMLPLIPVSGRVINQYGDPGAGMPVEATTDTSSARFNLYKQSQTDGQGAFRLFVVPGKYYIIAGSMYVGPRSGIVEIRTDGSPDLAYVATYYPSAADEQSATPVEVRAGGEITGLEIHMRTAPPRSNLTISGMVTGIPAAATATVSYSLGDDLSKMKTGGTSAVDSDGRFLFDNLSAGHIRLLAWCCSPEDALQSDVMEFRLQSASVSDVQLALTPGGIVTGELEIVGGDSATFAGKLSVRLTSVQSGVGAGVVGVDGAFRITGVGPGEFTVDVEGLPGNAYIQSVLLNEHATTGTLDFSNGVRGPRLKVSVALNGAQISGELHDSAGGPLLSPRPSVYLVPDRQEIGPNRLDAAIDGSRYVLKGVPPGKYKLFAADYVLVSAETMPAFLAAAETVEVAEDARVVRDLKMLEARNANPKQ